MKRELKPIKIDQNAYSSRIKFTPEAAELIYMYVKYNLEINKLNPQISDQIQKPVITRILLENMISIFINTDANFDEWIKNNPEKVQALDLATYFTQKKIKRRKT